MPDSPYSQPGMPYRMDADGPVQLPFAGASVRHQSQFKRWLQEWTIHQALRATNDAPIGDAPLSEESTGAGVSAQVPPGLIAPFESSTESFQPGCVRLFDSSLFPAANRPVYILILSNWAEDRKLVAPFSPFSVPASTMELDTCRDEPYLAVLSLWNQRVLDLETLSHSWLVTRLEKAELDDVMAVWQSGMLGDVLPAHLHALIGPPIEHEEDPRCQYQEEEASLFGSLDAKMFDTLEKEEPKADLIIAGQLWQTEPEAPAVLVVSEPRYLDDDLVVDIVACSTNEAWPTKWRGPHDVAFQTHEGDTWVAHLDHNDLKPVSYLLASAWLGSLPSEQLPKQQNLTSPPESNELAEARDTLAEAWERVTGVPVNWAKPAELESRALISAKAQGPSQKKTSEFAVGDTGLKLHLRAQSDGKTVEVSIHDGAGHLSKDLDGAVLIIGPVKEVAIASGMAEFSLGPMEFRIKLYFNGKTLELKRVSNGHQ